MGKHATSHKQVKVKVGEWEADIDEKIAPLIEALWELGIETTMSCQEDGWGYIWVEFPSASDMTEFLNAVAYFEEDEDSLYNRMVQEFSRSDEAGDWVFEVHPFDFRDHDHPAGGCDIGLAFSVSFPPSDLGVVLERLRGWRGRRRKERVAATMRPGHPRWEEFCARLEGLEGCNFRKGEDGRLVWDCGGDDRSFSRRILQDMGLSADAIEESFALFEEWGGLCDCEILFNVDR